MGAGIAASPHCAERRIRQTSDPGPRGTRSRTSAHQLRRRFPSPTPSEEEPCGLYSSAPAEASLLFRATWPDRSQSQPMFRGPSWDDPLSRPALLPDDPKIAFRRVAQSKDHLFRRLVPAGPEKLPKEPLTARRGDRTFGHLPHRPVVADPLARPGPPSRSQLDLAPRFRVATSEKSACKPVDNVDIGNNRRTFFDMPGRRGIQLPFRSPRPTSHKCLNRLPRPPTPPICRA